VSLTTFHPVAEAGDGNSNSAACVIDVGTDDVTLLVTSVIESSGMLSNRLEGDSSEHPEMAMPTRKATTRT